MPTEINKKALISFIDAIEKQPTRLVTFERTCELLTAIGFECRLASNLEKWKQTVTFVGAPSALVPVEAAVETPWGEQRVELKNRMGASRTVQSAIQEIHGIVDILSRKDHPLADNSQLIHRARELEALLIDELHGFTRRGSFEWPMDRFQLRIERGEHSEVVTIWGPATAILADAFLSDSTSPGIAMRDTATAVLKLLTEGEVERSSFHSTDNKVRDEALRAAASLREFAETLQ